MTDPEVRVKTDEARGGDTPHIVRYVLVISTLLAIAVLATLMFLN